MEWVYQTMRKHIGWLSLEMRRDNKKLMRCHVMVAARMAFWMFMRHCGCCIRNDILDRHRGCTCDEIRSAYSETSIWDLRIAVTVRVRSSFMHHARSSSPWKLLTAILKRGIMKTPTRDPTPVSESGRSTLILSGVCYSNYDAY